MVKVEVGVGLQVGLLAEMVLTGLMKAELGELFAQDTATINAAAFTITKKKIPRNRFMPVPSLFDAHGHTDREI